MKRGQHQKYRCPRHPPWKRRSHGGVSTMNGGVRGVEIHPVSSISKTWCLSHPAVHSHGEDQLSKSNQPTVILGIHPGNRCKFYSLDMDTTAWVWNRSVDLTWAGQMPKLCNQNVLVSQTKALTCLDRGHHLTRHRHKPSQQHQSFAKLLAASIAKLAPMSKPHLGGQWRPWVQAHLCSWITCSIIS